MIRNAKTVSKKYFILILTLSLTCWPLSALTDHTSSEQVQPATETPKDDSTESAQGEPTSEALEETNEQALPLWRKALSWYFSAGSMILVGALITSRHLFPEAFGRGVYLTSELTSPDLLQATHNTITDFGLNPDDITILNTQFPELPAIAIGGNVIALNEQLFKEYSSEEIRFIIGHELTHLQNKDIVKMGLVAFCLPVVVHFGLKAWDAAFKKAIATIKHTFSLKREGTIDQTLTKLQNINSWLSTFCLTKAVVAGNLFAAYSRYCEKQADITSITHLRSADGALKSLERFQEKAKTMRETNFLTRYLITPEGDSKLDAYHPPLSERIAYTQELAASHYLAKTTLQWLRTRQNELAQNHGGAI